MKTPPPNFEKCLQNHLRSSYLVLSYHCIYAKQFTNTTKKSRNVGTRIRYGPSASTHTNKISQVVTSCLNNV